MDDEKVDDGLDEIKSVVNSDSDSLTESFPGFIDSSKYSSVTLLTV